MKLGIAFVITFLIAIPTLVAQTIEGTVINSATSLPVRGVKVTIEAGGKSAYETTTDDKGAFRVDGVAAGLYTANFSDAEFLPAAPDSAARRPFRVGAGSDTVRLQAQLTPLGKISGRVFDRNDHPVPGAE